MGDTVVGSGTGRRGGFFRRFGAAFLFLVVVVELVVVVPRLGDVASTFSDVRWGWVALAVVVELLSMVGFAAVQRRMLLEGGVRPLFRSSFGVASAANALSLSLPAGAVLGAAYTYRRMRAWGASAPVAAWGLAATGVLMTTALATIALLGAFLVGSSHFPPALPLLVAALLLGAVLLLRHLGHHPERALSAAGTVLSYWNSLRRRPAALGRERLELLVRQFLVVQPSVRGISAGFTYSVLKWSADLACLVAACRAVDAPPVALGAFLVAYAAGAATTSLPISPGGVGVVEAALTLALVNAGMPLAVALPAVLVYRAVTLGTAFLNGWVCYLLISRADGSEQPLTRPVR